MLKATFKSSYRKMDKNNKPTTVFVHTVTGTKSELDAYKTAQGEFYKSDPDGTVLWFTTRFQGNTVGLNISAKSGKIVADNTEQDKMNSLIDQNKGALGDALAKLYAEQVMGIRHIPVAQDIAPANLSE
jgi:hypothetical protein